MKRGESLNPLTADVSGNTWTEASGDNSWENHISFSRQLLNQHVVSHLKVGELTGFRGRSLPTAGRGFVFTSIRGEIFHLRGSTRIRCVVVPVSGAVPGGAGGPFRRSLAASKSSQMCRSTAGWTRDVRVCNIWICECCNISLSPFSPASHMEELAQTRSTCSLQRRPASAEKPQNDLFNVF